MKTFKRIPLDGLIPPTVTSAVLYPFNRPTNSILLKGDRSTGLTGYIFSDPSGDKSILGNAVAAFKANTNIIPMETKPICMEILQGRDEDDINMSEWRFMIILRDFQTLTNAETIPDGFNWYHKNTIIWGCIHCEAEREFLRELMKS
jgi:hypothetical protein